MPKQSEAKTKFARLLKSQGRQRIWVSQELKVDHGTVSRWCSGERVIPPARVRELADLLGVHEEDIVEESVQQQRAGVA